MSIVSWSHARLNNHWSGKRLPTKAESDWDAERPVAICYPWGVQGVVPKLASYQDCAWDTQRVVLAAAKRGCDENL